MGNSTVTTSPLFQVRFTSTYEETFDWLETVSLPTMIFISLPFTHDGWRISRRNLTGLVTVTVSLVFSSSGKLVDWMIFTPLSFQFSDVAMNRFTNRESLLCR